MTMPVSHVTVRVPLTIRRRPGRKTLVSLGFGAEGGRIATKADPALLKALARAFRYQKLLDEGRYASISEMACSAVVIELPKGVFITITPFLDAAGMSTLSTPMPARPMTFRFGAASSTALVTFVELRIARPS